MYEMLNEGKANIYGRSFETLTHGAALGAITQKIAIFSTVHVPLVTPAFGAKARGKKAAIRFVIIYDQDSGRLMHFCSTSTRAVT